MMSIEKMWDDITFIHCEKVIKKVWCLLTPVLPV